MGDGEYIASVSGRAEELAATLHALSQRLEAIRQSSRDLAAELEQLAVARASEPAREALVPQ